MLRYQKWLSLILTYLSLYSFHIYSNVPTLSSLPSHIISSVTSRPPTIESLLSASPLLIIVFLAAYAILDIAFVVLTFNDCKEAAREVDEQVKEAREEMKRRKIL